ncbi:MAG TPA: ATPase, T2SS/T4P/T4SS family [Candidatus Eisenbacteria bacterium]|nr:ATPase, T2SS/T4P/T4SS family [Candidatus Eisenbacteria bacterium]
MSQTRSTKQTLSSILVDGGVVTQEQVEAAFQRQLETGRLIGETLVEMGCTSEENIGWGLSKQLGIPYVDIQTGAADLELVRSFPEALLRRLQAAPLFKSQDEIVVAMSDPTDPDAVSQLKEAAGRSVSLVIGCPSSIRRTLDAVFGPEREPVTPQPRAPRPSTSPAHQGEADGTPAHRVVWDRSGSTFVLYHVHAARSERASEIHFVPTPEGLAVLYRTDAGIEAKGVEHADAAVYLRSRLAHLGAPDLAPGCASAWGHAVVEVGSDTTHLEVCHCRTEAGITTVLRLLPDAKEAADLSTLGLSPIGEAEIRDLVEGPEGIVIVHGPPRAGGTTVLASLAALAARPERRMVVLEPWVLAPYPSDATRIAFGNDPPEALDWERLTVGLGADVVVLDDVLDGESIRQVLGGATVGRLVFARTDWLDPQRLLAFLAKSPNGRAVLRDRPFAMVALPAARREGSGAWTTPSESETQAGLLKATILTEEERDALLRGGRS